MDRKIRKKQRGKRKREVELDTPILRTFILFYSENPDFLQEPIGSGQRSEVEHIPSRKASRSGSVVTDDLRLSLLVLVHFTTDGRDYWILSNSSPPNRTIVWNLPRRSVRSLQTLKLLRCDPYFDFFFPRESEIIALSSRYDRMAIL